AAMAWGALPRFARAADALASHVTMPQDWATPTEYFDREITPTRVFFVRSHFGPPALRPGPRLVIDGLVARKLHLGVRERRRFDEVAATSVLQWAGNGRALALCSQRSRRARPRSDDASGLPHERRAAHACTWCAAADRRPGLDGQSLDQVACTAFRAGRRGR